MSTHNPTDTLVRLNNARLSFPALTAPKQGKPRDDGSIPAPRYEAAFLMDPQSPDVQAFYAKAQAMLQEKWPQPGKLRADSTVSDPQWLQVWNMIMSDRRLRGFGNGEEHINKTTMEVLDGYAGQVVINAKANVDRKPKFYGADGQPLMDVGSLYGGCYVNAYIQPWIQDNNHGKGIRCDVVAVQFAADGPAFGAAPIDTDSLIQAIPGAPAQVAPMAGQTVAPVVPTVPGAGWTP